MDNGGLGAIVWPAKRISTIEISIDTSLEILYRGDTFWKLSIRTKQKDNVYSEQTF